jgi:hypothetical protein
MNTVPYSKISYPPKDFVWKSGSDVQSLWRKHGWVPPSESMTPPPPEKPVTFEAKVLRYNGRVVK